MIRTIEVTINAANPELRLFEAAAFVGSPSTAFIRGIPPQLGAWRVTTVFVAAVYPDNQEYTIEAKKAADGVWTATIPATETSGRVAGGFQVLADGIDENGEPVSGYVLGVADFTIFDREITIDPGRGPSSVMRYFSTAPTVAKAGDVAKFDGVLKFYDGTAWIVFAEGGGGGDVESDAIAEEFSTAATYEVGEVVMHEGLRYKCTVAVTVAGEWNASNWTALPVQNDIHQLWGFYEAQQSMIDHMFYMEGVDAEYNSSSSYSVGDTCTYGGTWYKCTSATTGDFDVSAWNVITVAAAIAAKQDALSETQLANIAAVPNKANATDLRYAIGETITATAQLADRTMNRVAPAADNTSAIALTFPDATSGKARDFFALVTNTAGNTGSITFTTPQGATVYGDGFGATIASGETYLFMVTEVAANVFLVKSSKMEVPT